MGLETATYIDSLVPTNPDGGDLRSTADDHLRLIKAALKRTFPALSGEVSVSQGELNALKGVASNLQSQLNALRNSTTVAFAVQATYANSAGYAASASTAAYANSAGYAASAAFAAAGAANLQPYSAINLANQSISFSATTVAFFYTAPSLSLSLLASTAYRVEFLTVLRAVSASMTVGVRINTQGGAAGLFAGNVLPTVAGGGLTSRFGVTGTAVVAVGTVYTSATGGVRVELGNLAAGGAAGAARFDILSRGYLVALPLGPS